MRKSILPLAVVALLTVAAPEPCRAFVEGYALANDTGSIEFALPITTGPVHVSGGVGSSGESFAQVDVGVLRGRNSAVNPVSGLWTPQVDARSRMWFWVFGVQFSGVPDSLVGPITLTLHTRLTGHLEISGAHPYGASVNVSAGTMWMPSFLYGSLLLDQNGVTRSGLLASAPLVMNEYVLDVPLEFYLSNTDPGDLDLYLETAAGGTALGTEVNTATSDFGGPGWHFVNDGLVFSGLPSGVRVDIPELNVVDNHWLGGSVTDVPRAPAHPTTLALAPLANPARGTVRLALDLPQDGPVHVALFDVAGRHVATLLDGWQAAGHRELSWDGSGAPAGVYFARATVGGASASARVVRMP